MPNEGVREDSQGRGVGGGGSDRKGRMEREEGNLEGSRKRKLDSSSNNCMVQMYEILLLTPLSCSPPTISRKYDSQQSSEDEEEYVR